jgi:hypothetical protein
MPSRPDRPANVTPFFGVATTTPVAFVAQGTLHLERINMLADDGAGILTSVKVSVGEVLPVAFRLSTSKEAIRCRAEVLADIATTPSGLRLRDKVGTQTFVSIATAQLGDSATVMFRLSDLQEQAEAERRAKEAAAASPTGAGGAVAAVDAAAALCGISIKFLDLDAVSRQAVERHLRLSRHMSEMLALRGGKMVELGENERKTMSRLLDEEGNLSARALDW